jgi:hypothetical protein
MGLVTTLTFIAMALHLLSHCIPVLITNKTCYDALEPVLHHPIVIIAAWSFLPLIGYHFWKDRKVHTEIHRLQKENEDLKNQLRSKI